MAKLASFSVFFSYSRLVSANAVIMSASLPPEVSNSTEDNRGLNSSLLPLLDTIVCALSVCSNHSNSWRCRPGYERSIVDVIRWAIHTCMYCFKSVFKIREQFVDNFIYTRMCSSFVSSRSLGDWNEMWFTFGSMMTFWAKILTSLGCIGGRTSEWEGRSWIWLSLPPPR